MRLLLIDRDLRSLNLALADDNYGVSHARLVVATHLAGKFISARSSRFKRIIGAPGCPWHDWFKLYKHALVLRIRRQWSPIWLIGHDKETGASIEPLSH